MFRFLRFLKSELSHGEAEYGGLQWWRWMLLMMLITKIMTFIMKTRSLGDLLHTYRPTYLLHTFENITNTLRDLWPLTHQSDEYIMKNTFWETHLEKYNLRNGFLLKHFEKKNWELQINLQCWKRRPGWRWLPVIHFHILWKFYRFYFDENIFFILYIDNNLSSNIYSDWSVKYHNFKLVLNK